MSRATATISPKTQTCRYVRPTVNLSGELAELVYQVNCEEPFGQEDGDQEIRDSEPLEVSQYWENDEQEDFEDGQEELSALPGERSGGNMQGRSTH